MSHAEPRYLEAKRTVDDRALSGRVRDRLLEELPTGTERHTETHILEAGSGTGTMVPRLVDWGVSGTYRGVDRDETVVAFARSLRPAAFRASGQPVTERETGFEVEGLSVSFESGDALEAFGAEAGADLFVASGFADLVPIQELLSIVESSLRPGGLAYLPITFDGGTIFQPDHPADAHVERAYHQAIAEMPGRDPHAGRHLAEELRSRPGDLLAMAASDWIVRPVSGTYPGDEAFFLGRILDFVEASIRESTAEVLDSDDTSIRKSTAHVPDFEDWLSTRRSQVAAGTLTYVAHQYDLLYRTSTGSG